ncbi:MAG: hypothetical protein IJ786_03940 [Bacteroidaceae bacterium]|nr:hypothetical protein [Bacteroidaceae bacterium]
MYTHANRIGTCAELITFVQQIGFLPLLQSGIAGFSAEEIVDDDCRYVTFPDGGWDWPLWKWKGACITEGGLIYGKFFAHKAGFISPDWWPDFYNYHRATRPALIEGSIEEAIMDILEANGPMITRELRKACGFTGSNMRSRFDSFVTRLQMDCRIVTADFIYPRDKRGNEYGWGWSLLTTPESLYGRERCEAASHRTPEESRARIIAHLSEVLVGASLKSLERLI